MNEKRGKSVLVVHPQFEVIGGAELVSLCIIEWLIAKRGCSVTLLTLGRVDLTRIYQSTGIAIDKESCSLQVAYCPSVIRNSSGSFELLKLAFLQRAARQLSRTVDYCVCTYNECDFGRVGFQYIHFPVFAKKELIGRFLDKEQQYALLKGSQVFQLIYRKLIFAVSGGSEDGFRRNITAVNSQFTRELVWEAYQISGSVCYPALAGNAEPPKGGKPWAERKLAFASISRIAFNKDLIDLIVLFKAISLRFPEATFDLIGRISHAEVEGLVRDKAAELNIPLSIHIDATQEKKESILGNSKFYIHPKKYEHFGIALVEALSCGCIPFVHNSGGQVEIVTPEILRFESPDELPDKISSLIASSSLRVRVNEELGAVLASLRSNQFIECVGSMLDEAVNA